MREVYRLIRDLIGYSASTGRLAILLIIVIVALMAALSSAATVVGPVAFYPFL